MRVQPSRRMLLSALGAGMASALSGCAVVFDSNHDDADAPRAEPLSRPVRTAWVFGSGGPRGFVHVGVLKALEELGLRPDLIVGSSVGALVGSLCAAGLSASRIEEISLEMQPLAAASLSLFSDERLSGAPVAQLVREHAPVRLLERMPVAMACVAWRRRDASVVAFTAGDCGVAVQASAAIEGQFAPVRIRGEVYVDADAHMPLPVRVARSLGASRVLAVDASAHEDRAPASALRYREGDLRKRANIRTDAVLADLVLHPDFGYWINLSKEFRARAIEAGYRQTLAQSAALIRLHRG